MMDMILQPEMEMVARGLEKLLKVEQREFLMNMLLGVCSEESHRSAAEALGLVFSPEGNGDQHETTFVNRESKGRVPSPPPPFHPISLDVEAEMKLISH
ncbi:hypothetical protein JRO89_XS03G0009100 [Xanthoceras sorbifolium]|uniref:Uncharacterized protein n=1 Tax=Xanthoceras sorbifolium TaxID=99658 RepID=A0ABQ8I800_9ROSI|nr:hypothetical protein JRO89_XS03G0009100 [Xanthoceras sorbifolium]